MLLKGQANNALEAQKFWSGVNKKPDFIGIFVDKQVILLFDKKVYLSPLNKQNPTENELLRDSLKSLFISPSLMVRFTEYHLNT